MPGETVFDLLERIGSSDARELARLEARWNDLAAQQGPVAPAPFHDDPSRAEAVARDALTQADAAIREVAWAEQSLPAAEHQLAAQRRAGNGKWVLLGAVALIVLAILIGQVF